jgi:hypothetical protein
MIRTATISDCGRFRYRLGRRWADGAPLLFVMLNPSTADADQDDATIRRCIRFAQAEGFPALEVVNLFAFRATDPKDLRRAGYPAGPENDRHIQEAARAAAKVCLAWGSNAAGLERPQIVIPLLRAACAQLHVLRMTRSAHPQHPLMLPASCRLQPFDQAVEAAVERLLPPRANSQ